MAVRLDHLVVAAPSLIEGEAWVAERLGVEPGGRGRHATMATHNALWRLGEDVYLEVIAVDPEGVRPERPRWFGFDDAGITAALAAGPRLLTWAVAVDDRLDALAARAPVPHAAPVGLTRNGLAWQVALPEGRALPLGGAWPLTIRWTEGHPTWMLPDSGLTLRELTLAGEGVDTVRTALGEVGGPMVFLPSDAAFSMAAEIETPDGLVTF